MGRRGPPPKPTLEKILAGNPGEHALNKLEPDFAADDRIECPASIRGEGRLEWERIAPMLIEFGTLRRTDLQSFRKYCRIISDIERFEKVLDKIPTGLPHFKIMMYYQNMIIKLRTQARHYMQDLGLTPASRSQIKAVRPKGKNGATEKANGQAPGKSPILAFSQKAPGQS